MIRFRSISILLVVAALAVSARAQGTTGGLLYASDFANWTLPQGNTPAQGAIFYPNQDICKVTSNGYTFLAPKVGRPITIVDGANTETVTPTNVVIGSIGCSISATMAHSHSSYFLKSGTGGAQEAVDYQASQPQGANVVLTPAWTAAGGTTGIITGTLKGNAGVTLLDQRTAAITPYVWNGTNYTPQAFIGGVTASPRFSMFYQPNPGTTAAAVGDPNITTDGAGNLHAGSVAAGTTVSAPLLTATGAGSGSVAVSSTNGGTMSITPSTPGSAVNWTFDSTSSAAALASVGAASRTALGSALTIIPTFHCDGDSISVGSQLINQFNSYCYQIARAWGGQTVNRGIAGITSNIYDTQLFADKMPALPSVVVSYTIGTNNVSQSGADVNQENNFGINVEGQYAYIALQGTNYYTSAQGAPPTGITLTFGGSWSNSGTFGTSDPGKTCSGLTCSATITFTGPLLYVVTGMTTGNTAAATITCDGSATGVTPLFGGFAGSTLAQPQTGLFRVSLSNAAHSCVIQSTSSTGTAQLEWFGVPPGTSLTSTRVVLAGSIPTRNPDTNSALYRPFASAAVTQLSGDGLTNIVYVDNTAAYTNAVTSYTDGAVHPIDGVQIALATPYIAALNTLWGTSLVIPNQLFAFQSGNQDVAYGLCMTTNTTGSFNTCSLYSLVANTTGINNTTYGNNAGAANTTANQMSAFGQGVLAKNNGSGNTGIGSGAGQNNTTGTFNVFAGINSGLATTTASQGVAVGNNACANVTTGGLNVCVGTNTMQTGTNTSTNSVAVGASALNTSTGTQNTGLGALAGTTTTPANSNTTGTGNTWVGYNSGPDSTSQFNSQTGIGSGAHTGAAGAVEIGAGDNSTANTMAFMGFPFIDSSGNGTVHNLTITGACAGCGTFASVAWSTVLSGTNNSSALVLDTGASLTAINTADIAAATGHLKVNGVPVGPIASVSLTAQTASTGTVALFTTPAAGLYCADYSWYVQVAGGAGATLVANFSVNSGFNNIAQNGTQAAATATFQNVGQRLCFHAASGVSFNYSVTAGGTLGSLQYGFDASVTRVQ